MHSKTSDLVPATYISSCSELPEPDGLDTRRRVSSGQVAASVPVVELADVREQISTQMSEPL